RDVTFHLLGRLPWPLCDDLDDRRRGIGIGLDVECGEGYKAQAEKSRERDQHERAPQQAEGNQATQHSASIGSTIDSPQIGQCHCVESNRAVRRMGMIRKKYAGADHCSGVGNNSAEARGHRSPLSGAASGGPKVEKFFSYLTEK